MDERVREHAETLVDWSARVEAGDDVVLSVGEETEELAIAVAEALGERGANLISTYSHGEMERAYLLAHDGDFREPEHRLALYEAADVYLSLGGGRNTAALADVPGEIKTASRRAMERVREARLATDWVKTVHPTSSLAQAAGMADGEYRDFVYGAVLRDWESLAEEMARLKDIFDDGSEVRLESDGTDLGMSIDGRTAINSAASVAYDSHNLPSGEVFTAPYDTEGEVTFDVPMTIDGRRVRDVWLQFEGGGVVDFAAAEGEEAIETVLDTDEGSRRLGELGVGMNRGIDRPTDRILFDEKMAGTVHLALGSAYDACLPDGDAGNDSAIHTDLITDVTGDSRLLVDGEVVQRDGVFRWEDGFDG